MRDIMLIIHFLGLVMGLGTSLAHLFLGLASAKLNAEDARRFRIHSLVLSKMGHIGLALLLLSGGYLMTPYWENLHQMPTMIAKLCLVLVLIVLIVRIGNLKKQLNSANEDEILKKMEAAGKGTLLSGVLIVVLAVMTFH